MTTVAPELSSDIQLSVYHGHSVILHRDYSGTRRGLAFGDERNRDWTIRFLRLVAKHSPLAASEALVPLEDESGAIWLAEVSDDIATVCAYKSRSYAEVRRRSDEVISVTATQAQWGELADELDAAEWPRSR